MDPTNSRKLLRNGGKDDGERLDLTIPFIEFIGSPPAKHMGYDVNLESIPSPRAFKTNLPYEFVPGGLPHTTPAKYSKTSERRTLWGRAICPL